VTPSGRCRAPSPNQCADHDICARWPKMVPSALILPSLPGLLVTVRSPHAAGSATVQHMRCCVTWTISDGDSPFLGKDQQPVPGRMHITTWYGGHQGAGEYWASARAFGATFEQLAVRRAMCRAPRADDLHKLRRKNVGTAAEERAAGAAQETSALSLQRA
jgi:hypothetical protein